MHVTRPFLSKQRAVMPDYISVCVFSLSNYDIVSLTGSKVINHYKDSIITFVNFSLNTLHDNKVVC